MKTLYRYEISYMSYDDETDVVLKEYPVIRETDYCYFISPIRPVVGDKLKRIGKTAENTFAYDTKEKAKYHFIRRTKKRLAWIEFWKEEFKKGLEIIKTIEL